MASVGVAAPPLTASVLARDGITFRSPQAALEQGLGAIRSGNVELAIPALEAAVESDGRVGFLATFYLARVYADNGHARTEHGKAYALYHRIAEMSPSVDPDDDLRAPFVARSLMALAQYLRNGLPEIQLRANAVRAAQYINFAATVLSDEDAQFEHAKLLLTGDGVEPDTRRAVHWFSVLSQRGHAGAQAFLADLMYRGKHTPQDQKRALALITLAVENAPSSERIWIEDIYQVIYCGSTDGMRSEANGVVANWRQKYSRALDEATRLSPSLNGLSPNAVRTCRDGRLVLPAVREAGLNAAAGPTSGANPEARAAPPVGATGSPLSAPAGNGPATFEAPQRNRGQ
jgi:hypothetical protein